MSRRSSKNSVNISIKSTKFLLNKNKVIWFKLQKRLLDKYYIKRIYHYTNIYKK